MSVGKVLAVMVVLALVVLYGCSGSTGGSEFKISDFESTPSMLVSGEDTEVVLNWDCEGGSGEECFIEGYGSVSEGGSLTLNISDDTTLKLVCTAGGETAFSKVFLRAAKAPVVSSFYVTPPYMFSGYSGNAVFRWDYNSDTYPAPDCFIDNGIGGSDNKSVTTVIAQAGITYTLTCENTAGSSSGEVYITPHSLQDAGTPRTVTPEGGTFVWGHVKLTVPEGAVQNDVSVSAVTENPYLGEDNIMHYPVKFIPENLSFQLPVTVEISYDSNVYTLAGHDIGSTPLGAGLFDSGTLIKMPSDYSADNETVTFRTNTLATFTLTSAISDDDQPLKKDTMDMVRREETALFLPGRNLYVYDDAGAYYDMSNRELSEYSDMKSVVSADTDGDGREEIFLVRTDYSRFRVAVFRMNGDEPVLHQTLSSDDEQFSVLKDNYYKGFFSADITAGDIDGDDDKEIILVVSVTKQSQSPSIIDSIHHYDTYVFVLDNQDLRWVTVSGVKLEDYSRPRVAAGNIDSDNADEFFILARYTVEASGNSRRVESNRLLVYDNDTQLIKTVTKDTDTSENGSRIINYRYDLFDINAGNFDSDSRDEIVLTGVSSDYVTIEVLRDLESASPYEVQYRKRVSGDDLPAMFNGSEIIRGANSSYYKPARYFIDTVVDDFNGDGHDEVVAGMSAAFLYDDEEPFYAMHIPVHPDENFKYNTMFSSSENPYFGMQMAKYMASGDVNADGRAELFTLDYADGELMANIYAVAADDNPGLTWKRLKRWSWSADGDDSPIAVIGDFDADSVRVRYTGEHSQYKDKPRVIAVIAAPPVWSEESGIKQNLEGSKTEYGSSSSSGNEAGTEIGTTFGISLGYDFESPLVEFFKSEGGVSWDNETTKTNTVKKVYTYGTAYSTSAEYDSVVYQGPVYEVYKYEVLKHPDYDTLMPAPDGKKYLYINVPLPSLIYKEPVEDFNNESGGDTTIGTETFTHTPGDPFSYPDEDEMNAILAQWADTCKDEGEPEGQLCTMQGSQFRAIGSGSAESKTWMSFETETESGLTTVKVREEEAKICLWGFCVGLHGSSSDGSLYVNSVGNETEFIGWLGDIDPADYNEYVGRRYMYKLFTYFMERADGTKYQVLNYCVEPEVP